MSAHAVHEMHPHSLEAFRQDEPKFSERQLIIYDRIARHGPQTDREIAEALGFSDMNAVRPRITELIKANFLAECGEQKCPVTGKMVRVVGLIDRRGQLSLI